MSTLPKRLDSLLHREHVVYELVPHERDMTSRWTAYHTHTSAKKFAKPVILNADGRFLMLVVPAEFRVDLERLPHALEARSVRLATEEELADLCSGCELGAEPPIGRLFGMPLYASEELADCETLTFNAGTHDTAIRMSYGDWEKLARPLLLRIPLIH